MPVIRSGRKKIKTHFNEEILAQTQNNIHTELQNKDKNREKWQKRFEMGQFLTVIVQSRKL